MVALFVPYLIILVLSFAFLINHIQKLTELKDLQKLTKPLEELSCVIDSLNTEKVLKAFTFTYKGFNLPLVQRERRKLYHHLEILIRELNNDTTWREYCTCKELLNFREVLVELENSTYTDIKELLQKFDRYLNTYSFYYVELSKHLKQRDIAQNFDLLYNLHKFNIALSDLIAETFHFLRYKNGDYFYSLYYYRGEVVAYADTYYAMTDFKDLREEFKSEIYRSRFIEKLFSNPYGSPLMLLRDYLRFRKTLEKFHKENLEKIKQILEDRITLYRLRVWEILSLMALGLLSLLFINLTLYHYGQRRYLKLIERLEKRAFVDPLTGLYNRRFFNVYFLNFLRSKQREGKPYSVILLDLDNFKRINDTYGHLFGDKVLRHVAQIIRKNIRESDVAFRWGGEEFAILVPAPKEAAKRLAERLRKALENSPLKGVKITASFGVAQVDEDPKETFKKVDQALYRAKRAGKNRVEEA